jgi:hypothetical protein
VAPPAKPNRGMLDDTGANTDTQQSSMRHANVSTTMNIYGWASMEGKSEANSKVVHIVLPRSALCGVGFSGFAFTFRNMLIIMSYGAPGRIRTSDPLVRSQMLYPTELRAHVAGDATF